MDLDRRIELRLSVYDTDALPTELIQNYFVPELRLLAVGKLRQQAGLVRARFGLDESTDSWEIGCGSGSRTHQNRLMRPVYSRFTFPLRYFGGHARSRNATIRFTKTVLFRLSYESDYG